MDFWKPIFYVHAWTLQHTAWIQDRWNSLSTTHFQHFFCCNILIIMKFYVDDSGCNVTAIVLISAFCWCVVVALVEPQFKFLCPILLCCRSELVAAMTSIGNHLANSVWEANLKGRVKPSPSTHRLVRSCSYSPVCYFRIVWNFECLIKQPHFDCELLLSTN